MGGSWRQNVTSLYYLACLEFACSERQGTSEAMNLGVRLGIDPKLLAGLFPFGRGTHPPRI
jgi:hypothetical protein